MMKLWGGHIDIRGRTVTLRTPSARCGHGRVVERTFTFGSEVLAAFVYSNDASGVDALELVSRAAPDLPPVLPFSESAPPLPSLPAPEASSTGLDFWRSQQDPVSPQLDQVQAFEESAPFRNSLFVVLACVIATAVFWRAQRGGRASPFQGVVTSGEPAVEVSCGPCASLENSMDVASTCAEHAPVLRSMRNGHFSATFAEGSLIGRGGFGAVYRARHRLENEWYAVKLVPIDLTENEDVRTHRDFSEVSHLSKIAKCDSRHVVRYHTCWCEEPHCLPEALRESRDDRPTGTHLKTNVNTKACDFGGSSSSRVSLSSRFAFKESARDLSFMCEAPENHLLEFASGSGHSSLGRSWNGPSPKSRPTQRVQTGMQEPELQERCEAVYSAMLLVQMELCTGDTLHTWLRAPMRSREPLQFTRGRQDVPLELTFARHLVKGMRQIHAEGLAHRDLKPLNLFVTHEEVLKIGDFGLTRRVADSEDGRDEVGTPAYRAPEGGASATQAADIFSAGLITLELLCPPFTTDMERAHVLQAARRNPPTIPFHIDKFGFFLKKMVAHRPELRPTAEETHAELKAWLKASTA